MNKPVTKGKGIAIILLALLSVCALLLPLGAVPDRVLPIDGGGEGAFETFWTPANVQASNILGEQEPFPRVVALVPRWRGFVPDADEWNFSALILTSSAELLEARFIGVQAGDQLVTDRVRAYYSGWIEVVPVGRYREIEDQLNQYETSRRQLLEYYEQLQEPLPAGVAEKIIARTTAERERYSGIRTEINTILYEIYCKEPGRFEGITIFMPPLALIPGDTEIIELIFEVKKNDQARTHRITAPTSVSKLGIPAGGIEGDSLWVRGDLHIHSRYSDCACSTAHLYRIRDVHPNKIAGGYDFVYMTDHVGGNTTQDLHRAGCICPPSGPGIPHSPCMLPTRWQCYTLNTRRVTTVQIAFFHGVEYSTAGKPGGLDPFSGGHAVIHNLGSLVRRDGHTLFDFQLSGAELFQARPWGSHLAIAHPATSIPWGLNWEWGIISGYRGVEVIAPGPFAEFSWWRDRAFTPQALADAVAGKGVLSVRTGSDYHGSAGKPPFEHIQVYTYVRIPATRAQWQNASWSTRRAWVNNGLHLGQTIASERGGWGYVIVNGRLPGGVLRNVPANTTINFSLRFTAAVSGNYS
ncbi:MAG: hypothetical protein DDT30_01573 [Dehalococcoidia bacterium]|nr:hypothetical protein [Bacillota bacterium]